MSVFYSLFLFALIFLFAPFFTQAQITGSNAVCAGSLISTTDPNTGGIWSTGDAAIATVDGSGNVTGVAVGTVNISYTYVDISFALQVDILAVTVNPMPDAGSISGTNTVCEVATITLSDAALGGVWSSNNNATASVDAFGAVTGVAAGNTTISYSVTNGCGLAYVAATIFVTPLPTTGSVSGTATMCSGSGTSLTDPASGGIWSSNNSLTATVDGAGNVSGIAAGNTTISYSVTNSCGTLSATKSITVNPIPGSINGTPVVCEQSRRNLSDAVSGGLWTSGNTGTATVNSASGRVTGVSAGLVIITYTLPAGCFTSTPVTVNPLPHAGVITGTISFSAGGGATLADTASGGVWHSCNSLIATVNGSGSIIGVADGSTVISYAVTNSCGTAYAFATVRIGNCTTATNIATFAGSHVNGNTGDGGAATAAQIGSSFCIAADGVGNVYIADFTNHVIRKVDASGTISTIAGTGVAGYNGDNIAATSAQLNEPTGVTIDASGNLLIADKYNERIRKVNMSTGIITSIAGTGHHGGWQGYGYGNGGPATSANLDYPVSVATDCGGNIYIADQGSETVRKINASGTISQFAGTFGGGYNGDGIQAKTAQLNYPSCVLADCSGNVYIADTWNNRIRKVASNGIITTVAGNGTGTYAGDGGPATSASLWIPNSMTLDACGNMYICDWQNNVVRKVGTDGNISTFAGKNANDWHGYDGDGGPADTAFMYLPSSLAIDGLGNIYIADYGNYVIRVMGNLPYTSRMFAHGTTQDITICENALPVSINDLMAVPDVTDGKTEVWSVSMQPLHGTLTGFSATTTSRNGLTTPTGLTYTPETGYSGTDAFTVVMNDGVTASSTTVNVKINPLPNAGVITGGTGATNGTNISLADPTADANGAWSSNNNLIATVDASGNVTGIGNGIAIVSYTVTNGCGAKSATTGIVIESQSVQPKALLFPNPNNGTFQCEITSEADCELQLTVSDITGRIVHKQTINATTGLNTVNVNLPAYIQRPSILTVSIGNKNIKYPAVKITVTE